QSRGRAAYPGSGSSKQSFRDEAAEPWGDVLRPAGPFRADTTGRDFPRWNAKTRAISRLAEDSDALTTAGSAASGARPSPI
ncbi:MAG TPA: hypothetical protein VIY86_01865, partial [Pirellulaceae bacterium]